MPRDELEYLQAQGRSQLGRHGGGGPSYVIPKVCHLCGDDTERGKQDGEMIGWICYECDTARTNARKDLAKLEKTD